MSTRKRPLSELTTNLPTTNISRTPSTSHQHNNTSTSRRYHPSTPHAIHALAQRSAAKQTRSAARNSAHRLRTIRKIVPDEVDPLSARGVLRRFAKITAPGTRQRKSKTPGVDVGVGKENVRPDDEEEDDEEGRELKRPKMTFDFDDDEDDESLEGVRPEFTLLEEDEDEEGESEVLGAPTLSVLPEDGEEGTITFKSIDFARQEGTRRRVSRRSEPLGEEEDDEATIMTERGRRAITEDANMTGRLSRYSFGSIRMSDFGSELEVARRESGKRVSDGKSLPEDVLLDETGDLYRFMRQEQAGDATEVEMDEPVVMDDDFQLEMPRDETVIAAEVDRQPPLPLEAEDGWEDEEVEAEPVHLSPKSKRRLTTMQLASSKQETGRRRRRVKMTKHGTLVPALPTSLIKKIATEVQVSNGRRKPAFGPDHTAAIEQATEWFFEQIGEDLAAYSSHGRRKRRIDASDVHMLMQRQRMALEPGKLKKLAKQWLPKDVLATVELPDE